MNLLLLVLVAAPLSGLDDEVTISSLLEEMADLRGLARLPEIPYVARQASSYDRRSTSPQDAESWFANRDAGQYVRVEDVEGGGKRYVMMDVAGPGAVTRIWSANPKGTLRIHIDGEVALEAPMADLLQGKHEPFTEPFAYNASRGCNIYFPFPYRKSCKITSDEPDFYYQVGYRTYPEGTKVEPFRLPDLKKIEATMRQVAGRLMEPASAVEPPETARATTLRLEPGALQEIAAPEGGGAAHTLILRPPSVEPVKLRRAVLSIRFDGNETVRAPLGDFFGTGPGANAFRSLPLTVSEEGTLISRWVMPFREKMEIGIEGEEAATIEGSVLVEPVRWDDRSMLFHALWRADYEMPTLPRRDWNYLEVTGQGVYVGNLLNIANPVRTWWGEGDEKIYVDGETFPSHFGTGTEDYYGYAWGSPGLFTRPYHSQSRCDGPGTYGHTSLNRWHIIDAIPFRKDFRFDIEVWHWRDVKVAYESVNYYYGRPGCNDNRPPLAAGDLRIAEIPELKLLVIEGAVEGERLKPVVSGGEAAPQEMAGFGAEKWSWDSHLWWRDAKPGDTMQLSFGAPKAAAYHVIVHLTRAPDYGTHRITVGGAEEGKEVDLWAEEVEPTGPIDLGVHDLVEKGNELKVEITGTNDKADPKRYMFGLDCIVLKPVEGGGE